MILDRLKNIFRVSKQDENFARSFWRLFGNQYQVPDYDINNVIENTYEINDAVFRAIRLLVDSITQLNYKIVKGTPEGEELITEHPFYEVLTQPNANQTWWDFVALEMTYYLVTGNSYIYKLFPREGMNKGEIKALHVLPAQLVTIVRSDDFFNPVKHYEIEYLSGLKIEHENIIHRKTVNLDYESSYGMSPLAPANRLITTSNDTKTAAMRLLQNSGMLGILVSKASEGLDETGLKTVADSIRANFTGANNYGKFPVVSEAMEWVQIGLKSTDLQLLQTDAQTEKQIAGLWNIPSVLMSYDDASTYDNMNQARKQLYTNAAIPQFRRLLDTLTRQALWSYGDNTLKLKVVTDGVPELEENKKELSESLAKADFLTLNQKRAEWGAEPYEAPEADIPVKLLDMLFAGGAESEEINNSEDE